MMATSEAYGDRLAKRLRVENVRATITRLRQNAIMAITEIRCDDPLPAIVCSTQREDAFVITLHLRDRPNHEYWEDGRRALVCDFRAGEISLRDLKRDPSALLDKPYHSLLFYLSREALNAIADDVSAPRICDLNHKPGSSIEDATIFRLGSSVLPGLSRPDQANRLFVDAPWQERRAKEIISANLGGVPLADVARECRLSTSHFQRAFHRTVGMPAHKWLLSRRIELAKEKLRVGRSSLSDVALACGFSDQSHLTRIFSQLVGITPGAWRRVLDE
jgi:AraC family transcriptional regulator